MAKPQKFPMTVKAGATAIKIYRSPLRVPVTSGPKANTGAVTNYDSYLVVHYRAGKRERRRFNSVELAQAEAARIRALLLNEDASGLQLTGRDLLAFSQANRMAQEFSVSLETLATEYAAAKKILGEVSVIEAAQFYRRYGTTVKEKKTVGEVAAELIAGLKADHKSEYHIRDMERRLGIFAQHFAGFITEVETKAINEWLRDLKGTDNDGKDIIFAPKTRNHYRNAVAQLFNYARDHGYLPKGMPTEVEGVKPLDVVPPENEIFTVEEMIELLNHAPEYLIAPLAIKAFSGVRTEEMVRMDWSAVNFETKHITLSADVTKTKQRRLIPMAENLVAWLAPFRGRTGRISARWVTPQTLVQAFDRFGRSREIHVGANKFRNSYISYRVAVTHDVQRVALESGNSPRVIQREYLELATEADGNRWFDIYPPEIRETGATEKTRPAKPRTIIRKRREA
jgi:integrase